MEKKRLDIYIFEKGLTQSRERARSLIMEGVVYVNGQKSDKPGTPVSEADEIDVRSHGLKYVSRGGLKLEKALAVFPATPRGKISMDVGASTGGFTDCMLQNGAVRVYAVDVGYGQLAWSLRTDDRVVNLERTNFRYVTAENIPEKIGFASVDVSFISLYHILPTLFSLLDDNGEAVCLIKPQFEAGRENVGKKGVVRDPQTHIDVIKKVVKLASEDGFEIRGLDFSPIRGPEGNIEYLMYIVKTETPDTDIQSLEGLILETVRRSGEQL